MCGIAAAVGLSGTPVIGLQDRLATMSYLVRHRGPDGEGSWTNDRGSVGLAHRRLEIIDLETGDQPMAGPGGTQITFNGEIYNYIELRQELGQERFRTRSDTEVILEGYARWGSDVVSHLRGMFAFALWDPRDESLFCARDRFGMKPLYYAQSDGVLHLASECKALLPFLPRIETDTEGLRDYLTFQFCLGGKTLFAGIRELPPGHVMVVRNGRVEITRYWDVYYEPDFDHTSRYFEDALRSLVGDSVQVHLRADVPLGTYLSGGLDSSIVASVAADLGEPNLHAFHGKFAGPGYDESRYARDVATQRGMVLREIEIGAELLAETLPSVIYHLDYPVAGPGAFPQYHVSRLARRERKVVLGGQGGDELFGGYARYLIAYFEQCLKAAIDGTMGNGNFIVSYESILPNLETLREYKPLLQEFWREGLFAPMDQRYFRLINRANNFGSEIRWSLLGAYDPFETFRAIYLADNLTGESYFDRMSHFDFKTLLPALLQVEDRMSMAHGLESRLPLLDHPIVALAASIPSDIKFEGGMLKRVLKKSFGEVLPQSVRNRRDKMGFPTPLNEWALGPARDFVRDTLSSPQALSRQFVDNRVVLRRLGSDGTFGRGFWGLLSLELWHEQFHDREAYFKSLPSAIKEGVVS